MISDGGNSSGGQSCNTKREIVVRKKKRMFLNGNKKDNSLQCQTCICQLHQEGGSGFPL